MTSISAVLPAYNEEALIAATAMGMADELAKHVDDYEVIVVNDGSHDRTQQVVEQLMTENSHIRLVNHPVNRGYGSALKTGFDSATKDLIFLTDGDKQFDLTEIARFIPEIERGADLVIGYRAPRRDPFIRLLYAKGWKVVVTLLFGYTARDVDCAFKLFKREVWERITVHSGGATFSAELLVKARGCGYRIRELPVKHLPRLAGRPTGGNPRVILRAFRDIIWLRLHLEPCPEEYPSRAARSGDRPTESSPVTP